jgi:hypothetical protein
MAITSNRIATQSEIITGRSNSEEAVRQRARAAEFSKEAKELRGQFREIHAERSPGRDERTAPEAAKKAPEQKTVKEHRSDSRRPPLQK